MARQSIFTDCTIRPRPTRQSNPLPLWMKQPPSIFLKCSPYLTHRGSAHVPRGLPKRPAVCFEKPSSLWLAGQSCIGTAGPTSPVAETCPRAAAEPHPTKQVKRTAGPGATFLVRFPQQAPAPRTMKELPESGLCPMLCCGIPSAVLAPEQPTPATRHAPVLGPTQLPVTTSTLPCPPRAEARRG